MSIFIPFFVSANIICKDNANNLGRIRKVIISDIELHIPREYLVKNSRCQGDGVEKAIIGAFSYPNTALSNEKNLVQFWFEDIREYNTTCSKAVKEVQESLKDKDNNRKLKERKIFNQIDFARN